MNFLVIMCDHLRYDAISAHDNPYINTPNIDRLVRKSIDFKNGYTQSPLCGPARHALATGKYPYANGVINNDLLPFEGMYTIAHALKDKGYRRFCFGHMHWNDPGIDTGYEGYLALEKEVPALLSERELKQFDWEKQSLTKKFTAGPTTRKKEQFWGQLVTDAAIEKIRGFARNNEKFLAWLSYNEPHPPFYPPKKYFEKYASKDFPLPLRVPEGACPPHESIIKKQKWGHLTDADMKRMKAGYYGLIEMTDEWIGEILNTMDEYNLWENTMVIFTCDHGDQMGDHDLFFKFVNREQSIHLPYIIYHPDLEAGTRTEFVEHVDIFPTICDYAGVSIPNDVQGKSLRPVLENRNVTKPWKKCVFSQINDHIMIRTEDWKLNIYEGVPGELFNMKDDPSELYNLINENSYAEKIKELMDLLDKEHPGVIETSRNLLKSDRLRKPKPKYGYDFNQGTNE